MTDSFDYTEPIKKPDWFQLFDDIVYIGRSVLKNKEERALENIKKAEFKKEFKKCQDIWEKDWYFDYSSKSKKNKT